MENKKGTIVVLYGVPCVGKTTVAHELQDLSQEPLYLLGIDAWTDHVMPQKFYFGKEQEQGFSGYSIGDEWGVKFGVVGQQAMKALHQAIAELARQGYSVIVDHIFYDEQWLEDCKNAWKDFPVIWVHLGVSLEELLKREGERKKIGEHTNEHLQYCVRRLHKNIPKSLEIDTSKVSSKEAAELILQELKK